MLLPPPLPLEVDIGLAQTLWRVKAQAEELASAPALTNWETVVTNVAGGLGLDVMTWQAGIWQLPNITRPCFIEVLPEPSVSRPELWVIARGVPDGVVLYQEPDRADYRAPDNGCGRYGLGSSTSRWKRVSIVAPRSS